MSIDVGYLEYQQRQQQNAADGAAVGAAQQLIYTGCPNQSVAQNVAASDSQENDFANAGNVTVTADNPPQSGPFISDNCAVNVTVHNGSAQTFFTRIYGWTTGMPETTQATATISLNGNGCVYQLDPNGTPTFHGAKINAPGCSLQMNGSPTFDGGDVDFQSIGYAGSVTVHGTNFDAGSPQRMLPVADPCPEITGCNEIANNPPTSQNCIAMPAGATVLSPGCYSSLTGSGGTLTLSPGLYILSGTNSLNGYTITGTGVTLYVTSTGSGVDFHGDQVNLSACTTSCANGAVQNVLYYQANNSPVNIAGPNGSYTGLFYAPKASVTYDGNAGSGYSVMVFYDWLLEGTGQSMTFASPAPNQSFVKNAVLVQ